MRSTTARFLVPLVYKMGPGRLLSGIKDVTDRILPTAANFLLDASPDTRYAHRSSFALTWLYSGADTRTCTCTLL